MKTPLKISLPKSMKAWVDQQVEQGGFDTAGDFVRKVLTDAQKRQLRERIDQNLLDALDSGPPIEVNDAFWKERRNELARRINAKKKKK